jgi:hypothetical protein
MLVEAIGKPMCYRWPEGEVQLVPGKPVDLPEARALRLLEKAPGKVRLVQQPTIAPGRVIAWEGPDLARRCAIVDFLHTDSDGTRWAFVTLPDGAWAAVNLKYATVWKDSANAKP